MIKSMFAGMGLLIPSLLTAAPWAQYNGTNHDRIATEKVKKWASKPKQVWSVPAQHGFSSFVTGEKAVFSLIGTLGDEFCAAFDKKTGEQLWKTSLCTIKYNGGGGTGAKDNRGGDGPRSTPSYDNGRVYVYDASMKLHCLDAKSGKSIWIKDIVEDYSGRNIRWQNAVSPLVDGDSVYVIGGGAGESVLAFNKSNGKLLWKKHDTIMTHATPIMAELHGVKQLVFLTQDGILSVDPKNGDKLWEADHPFRIASAASPIIYENYIYASSGYSVGASVFKVSKKGSQFSTEKVWYKENDLINHWSTPVCLEGKLYGMFGFKKYGKGPLKCVDLATGKELWSKDGFGPGNCILVGDRLMVLSDTGELVQVVANSSSYQELSRVKALKGKCWSMPTYSDGMLYLRSTEEGACFVIAN